jgi:hypothetical protein
MTTTCGRSSARVSSSLRNASCVSGGDVPMTPSGSTPIASRNLDEGPVGDALAVVQTAPTHDVGGVAHALEEVRDEARLADPGGPEQREEAACAVGDSVLEVTPQPLPLALTADERRLQVTRNRVRVRQHVDETERLDRLGLPLERERLDRLQPNRVAHEASRAGADEHVAGGRRLLQASRDVDGVASDERLAGAPDDDLAGVDSETRLQPVLCDRGSHLPGRAHRPQCIVFVGDGDAEDGHDSVADELLDRAPVPFDDRAQVVEVAAHPRPQRLGIRRLPERGRADDVAEKDGDHLSRLAGRLSHDELCSAGVAEARVLRVRAAAIRARRHARSAGADDVLYERAGWSSASSTSSTNEAAC